MTAITIDTAVVGDAVRNLTSWADPAASRLFFAVGNACFASVFIGRRAVMLLWAAFVIAFLLPLRERLGALDDVMDGLPAPVADVVGHATDALFSASTAVKSLVDQSVAAVRERFSYSG